MHALFGSEAATTLALQVVPAFSLFGTSTGFISPVDVVVGG
jgi:hypothetical protein